ncbi:hypothetical protein [Ktedonospora formicarum]|nr:hypothetical protein [Ktedonospora formicarum]
MTEPIMSSPDSTVIFREVSASKTGGRIGGYEPEPGHLANATCVTSA